MSSADYAAITVDSSYDFLPQDSLHETAYFLLSRLVWSIFKPVFRLVYGFRVVGTQHMQGLQGAVTVCNHMHMLDCVMLACAFAPRRLYYLSLKSNFEIPVVSGIIRALGAMPVPDTPSGFKQLYRACDTLLDAGDILQVYPEGSRVSGCRTLRPFRDGAFVFAARSGVPVVPCVLRRYARRGPFGLPCPAGIELAVLPPLWPQAGQPARRAAQEMSVCAYAQMDAALRQNHPAH